MKFFKNIFSKKTNLPVETSNIVKDIEGNIYGTIEIGSQTWMTENLKTTKFNDGTPIEILENDFLWGSGFSPFLCYYENDKKNKDIFGILYNWYVLDSQKNVNKNICPKGWHVPSVDEWKILHNTLQNNFGKSNNAAKALASNSFWQLSDKLNVVGNDISINNNSGFSGKPGGYRYSDGKYYGKNANSFWWTATNYDPKENIFYQALSASKGNTQQGYKHGYAWAYAIFCDSNEIVVSNKIPTNSGLYIRCIKD